MILAEATSSVNAESEPRFLQNIARFSRVSALLFLRLAPPLLLLIVFLVFTILTAFLFLTEVFSLNLGLIKNS
ncbi:hypothetical protein BZZ01_24875 [Nostocales cyanobacterium HT-58-2]|nr:hypothetical protein BZZ01_24875 [Nostocales cyanobacterium HT-58-2]